MSSNLCHQLTSLDTEQINSATQQIDQLTTLEQVKLINAQDHLVAQAVAQALPQIANAVDLISQSLKSGGRLIYLGAGTSGRLGVLDAVECPPTYNTPTDLVVGIIAGGNQALTKAIEGVEDNAEQGAHDLAQLNLTALDIVCGIAASGRTPYVIGGLDYARQCGCKTIALSCNNNSAISINSNVAIEVPVGAEVISGSTRMKSGSAQKMVLNMLTTATMINLGKTYGNLMVDVQATNAKLKARSINILTKITDLSQLEAQTLLEQANGSVKIAIVMHKLACSYTEAKNKLAINHGIISITLQSA
ncbi:MAG: N-acetylmuramic acid 6-phosphate etherase [Pseudomonadota bacterium]|jgi:N-acetylmuramic acid 6-phosphate etherase